MKLDPHDIHSDYCYWCQQRKIVLFPAIHYNRKGERLDNIEMCLECIRKDANYDGHPTKVFHILPGGGLKRYDYE